MGLTAFGQESIRPISREIRGGDTVTIFSISSEREILYRLYLGQHCIKETQILDSLVMTQDSVIKALELRVEAQGQIIAGQDSVSGKKDLVIESKDKRIADGEKKLRRWKIGTASGGALILLIILLL